MYEGNGAAENGYYLVQGLVAIVKGTIMVVW